MARATTLLSLALLVTLAGSEVLAQPPAYQRTRQSQHRQWQGGSVTSQSYAASQGFAGHSGHSSQHFSNASRQPHYSQQNSRPAQGFSGGNFQRPYPYHLDYYRMRYGGSYAPYFGNLYGPPNVIVQPTFQGGYGIP